MIFNSRDELCKYPFGAVLAGTKVRFSFRPPRSWMVRDAYLCMRDEINNICKESEMTWLGSEDDQDLYNCVIDTAGLCGPVWYWFRWNYSGGTSCFYGNNHQGLGGEGQWYDKEPRPFQLTVYQSNANVPQWYGEGVTYHIFPDRFAKKGEPSGVSGLIGNRKVHREWDACPDFLPDKNGEIKNCDFFGGNIGGVIDKLPYLESLGVTTLYFSPIFEAASNHRYDTADYTKVDKMFGIEEQFVRLCELAAKRGMRVMLDGVFNHTGYDSIYFNGRGSYSNSLGAYQSKNSPYYNWYSFDRWPNEYSSWWGIYTLPQVNESHPDYVDYIISNKDSVVRRWLRLGASGWRLDVADELPDEFIAKLAASAKREKKDAVIIGEVWEDASNKISYGVRRRYLLGGELDGVMNYPFRNHLIGYLLGGDAKEFAENMECLRENYPKHIFYNLMNIIGTHDTPRILTVLGAEPEDWAAPRTVRANSLLSAEKRALAIKRLMLAAVVQFSFPGSPCVYYGDEAGLEGYEDPFNRRTYPWGKEEAALVAWYSKLGHIRKNSEVLRKGSLRFHKCDGELLTFSRSFAQCHALTAINRAFSPCLLSVPWEKRTALDALSGRRYLVENGKIKLTLQPLSAVLFVDNI